MSFGILFIPREGERWKSPEQLVTPLEGGCVSNMSESLPYKIGTETSEWRNVLRLIFYLSIMFIMPKSTFISISLWYKSIA